MDRSNLHSLDTRLRRRAESEADRLARLAIAELTAFRAGDRLACYDAARAVTRLVRVVMNDALDVEATL